MTCPEYISLYRENPGAALTPEKEYERYKMQEGSDENRAEAKEERYAGYRERANRRLEKQAARWKKPEETAAPAFTMDEPIPDTPPDEPANVPNVPNVPNVLDELTEPEREPARTTFAPGSLDDLLKG
jgi:hypothetical protein